MGVARNRAGQRGIRYLAGFIATVCLLSQSSGIAHNLLVRHATCAEHGEIIHPSGDVPSVGGSTTEVAAHAVLGGAGESQSTKGHGHDHCLAVARGRGHVGLRAVAATVTTDRPAEAIVAFEAGLRGSDSYALYRLAPKNSPPA